MKEVKYEESLKRDLIEQFRGRENIEKFVTVLGEELNDVFKFFSNIRNKTDLSTVEYDKKSKEDKQLDGLGDIVVLSRKEAGELLGNPASVEVISNEEYHHCLKYKVLKNTCNCTYYDIMKVVDMFWKDEEHRLRYSEDPTYPATIIFDFEMYRDMAEKIFSLPFLRAGGVGILMRMLKKDELPIYCGFARAQMMTREIGCEPEVIEERTYLTDEDGNILKDDDGNWLAI